ncbi:hypothetical protein [Larkinella terrae]|uniref:hypothetical protein n=1 Tax=Larkinella terrae TaxID=2025311 RepID=UPI001E58594A|nr:hypothetical protein [Larkinella terrae]
MYAKTSNAIKKTSVIMGARLDFLEPVDGFVKNDEAEQGGNGQNKESFHFTGCLKLLRNWQKDLHEKPATPTFAQAIVFQIVTEKHFSLTWFYTSLTFSFWKGRISILTGWCHATFPGSSSIPVHKQYFPDVRGRMPWC